MSQMQEFYERVAKDGTLQAKFSKIMAQAEQDGREATEKKLIAFAKGEGFEISIPEMQDFFENMSEAGTGELSDAELDMVAGGKSFQGGALIALSVVTLGVGCALGSALGAIGGVCEDMFK